MEGMVVALTGSADDVEILPTVAVYDAWFAPRDLVVHQGDTVRWAFGGVLPHTVTADDGLFDSGILEPGAIFTFTFDELGTYSYSCIVHPSMIGTVTVVPPDEEIPASRSGISAIDAGDDGRAPASVQFARGRGNPSDGAGAMVLLGLGLLMGLAVGVLYGVGKIATRRPAAIGG
jgi:plastocyanin